MIEQAGRAGAYSHRVLLDFLPVNRRYTVVIPDESEIAQLFAITEKHLPQVTGLEALAFALHRQSQSILAVRTASRLIGGVSFLSLNQFGFQKLKSGDLNIRSADPMHLCCVGEPATALYALSLCLPGIAVAAMGNVMAWLRQPRYAAADIYARPGSGLGEKFMIRTGYVPLEGATCEGSRLWVYRRPHVIV